MNQEQVPIEIPPVKDSWRNPIWKHNARWIEFKIMRVQFLIGFALSLTLWVIYINSPSNNKLILPIISVCLSGLSWAIYSVRSRVIFKLTPEGNNAFKLLEKALLGWTVMGIIVVLAHQTIFINTLFAWFVLVIIAPGNRASYLMKNGKMFDKS